MESLFTTTLSHRQFYSLSRLSCCCHLNLLSPRPIINSDDNKYHHHHLQLKMRNKTSLDQLPSTTTRTHCGKMYVPGFGKPSPEAKAAAQLHNFFTYIAVNIVSAQLQSYNPEAYEELMEFVSRNTLDDGDKFCATLMRESSRHKNLALRILEVRAAYCKRDFEWDNLKRLAAKMADDCNTKLMRDYVLETTSSVDTTE